MPALAYPSIPFLMAIREVTNIHFYRIVDHLISYFDERYPVLQLCYQYDVFVALNVLLDHLRHQPDEEERNIYRPLMILKQHVASLRHANFHSKLEYQDMSFTKPNIVKILNHLPELIERFTILHIKFRQDTQAVANSLLALYQQYYQTCTQHRLGIDLPTQVSFLTWTKGQMTLLIPQGKSLGWYRDHHLEALLKDRTLSVVSGPWAGQQCYMLRPEVGLVLNRKTSKCENLTSDTLLMFDPKK